MPEDPGPGAFHEASHRDDQTRDLIAAVRLLVMEYYMTYGSWPAPRWLETQIGISPKA